MAPILPSCAPRGRDRINGTLHLPRLLLGHDVTDVVFEQRKHVGIGIGLLLADPLEPLGKRARHWVLLAAADPDLVLERSLDLRRLLLAGARRVVEPLHVVAADPVDGQVVAQAVDLHGLAHERPGLRAVLVDVEVAVALAPRRQIARTRTRRR
jgi:hypothetical protein